MRTTLLERSYTGIELKRGHVRTGSFATETRCPRCVRFSLDSERRADISAFSRVPHADIPVEVGFRPNAAQQSAPRLIADVTAALAQPCQSQTIICRDGVHLLDGGLPSLMDSIRRCRTGG